ncbi:hypothetical protein HNY73_006844 [Argiope bruennichi]|uniref:Uncharacterized protein n=1 Tax=Argiope bruennichi TaxID=94029 RepID=A0A8T0FHP2_ARGBR|nr:hypothetical protein HNY73_006844 [Argiope bruennichi]
MANPIDYQLKSLRRLSLEDISLRRVAVLLLSDPFKYMYQTTVENEHGEKRVVSRDEQFKSIVAELGLPESMRGPLVNIMNLIFQEARDWLRFHETFLKLSHSRFYNGKYMKHVHWTYMGTVNYRKTAEAIIRDENLSIDRRFWLACLYCLEDDIQDLWQKLPPLSKKSFFNNGDPDRYDPPSEIIVFWTCILSGREYKIDSFHMGAERRFSSIYQYAFEFFAYKGYETATQYFFEKLTCEEKDASLLRTAQAVVVEGGPFFKLYYDVSCYLLSQLNVEQFQKVLEDSPGAVLKIFLIWPRQDVLIEVAKLALPYFQRSDYESLPYYLYRQFQLKYQSRKLLWDLLLVMPKDSRHSTFYLNEFFTNENPEMFKFVFRNMDPAETLEFFLNDIILNHCCDLMEEGKWDCLEFFIRESRLSKEGREKFAVTFNSIFASLLELEILERFTNMMNDI